MPCDRFLFCFVSIYRIFHRVNKDIICGEYLAIVVPSGARIFLLKKLFHLYMLTLEVGWPHLDMP